MPALVAKELDDYTSFRTAEFNARRTSAQVVSTTVESDKSTALRLLNYLNNKEGQNNPSVKLFAHASMGDWVERYLQWLKGDLGLKSSTLAVYCNSIISVATYALTLVSEKARDGVQLEPLLNLRRQAESLSKHEKLFEVKSKNWLSWETAQEARVRAFEKYAQAKKDGAPLFERSQLLRDCLILAFHTLQPPDRVGRTGAGHRLLDHVGVAAREDDRGALEEHPLRALRLPPVAALGLLLWQSTNP